MTVDSQFSFEESHFLNLLFDCSTPSKYTLQSPHPADNDGCFTSFQTYESPDELASDLHIPQSPPHPDTNDSDLFGASLEDTSGDPRYAYARLIQTDGDCVCPSQLLERGHQIPILRSFDSTPQTPFSDDIGDTSPDSRPEEAEETERTTPSLEPTTHPHQTLTDPDSERLARKKARASQKVLITHKDGEMQPCLADSINLTFQYLRSLRTLPLGLNKTSLNAAIKRGTLLGGLYWVKGMPEDTVASSLGARELKAKMTPEGRYGGRKLQPPQVTTEDDPWFERPITSFMSTADAGRAFGIDPESIRNAIKGRSAVPTKYGNHRFRRLQEIYQQKPRRDRGERRSGKRVECSHARTIVSSARSQIIGKSGRGVCKPVLGFDTLKDPDCMTPTEFEGIVAAAVAREWNHKTY